MTPRAALPLFALLACLLTEHAGAAAEGFRVLRAELARHDTSWVLNADIDYRFSEAAIDALRNGVPLALEWRLVIVHDRPWAWDEAVFDTRRRLRVRYHSLAKLFQLLPEGADETPRNYASLNTLMENLGALRALPIAPLEQLRDGEHYRAKLAVRLDIESLPLPLRPIAYLTPAWRLHSPWYRWTLAN